MTDETDGLDLRAYAETGSEAAFARIVQRHLEFVYAVALRQVGGDAHLAHDVVQLVFTALARKAEPLSTRATLGGWLYRTTHFTARDLVRAERRRRAREAAAYIMAENPNSPATAADWERLRPTLDDAMAELKDVDRDAIWLRFFAGRPFADIGAQLRLTENAARMRVERALERLQGGLARRGITSTSSALAAGLALPSGAAVPVGLQATIVSSAMAAAAGAAGAGSGTLLTILSMSKIKMGIAAALVAGALSVAVREVHATRLAETELHSLRAARDEMTQLRRDNVQLAAAAVLTPEPDVTELTRLRSRVVQLETRSGKTADGGMKIGTDWRNVGRGTPTAAWETLQWALLNNDVDVLATLLDFGPDGKARLDAFFAGLSPEARARHGTPERMLAAINPSQPVQAFQVLSASEMGGKAVVRVRTRNAAGREREQSIPFRRIDDGWRATLRDAAFVDAVVAKLDPVTGAPRGR